jgi:FkbM family methyltransferase
MKATTGHSRERVRATLRTALRAYPLRGGYRTVGRRLRRFRPRSEQLVRLRCGPWIWVDPRDHLGNIVYWMGDSDPRITRLCLTLLRPGDTALDLGANCGVEALAMAAAVGPGGRVVACEPQVGCAAALRRSAAANGFAQLEVRAAAVTNHEGTVRFDPTDISVTGRVSGSGSEVVPAIDAANLFRELAPIRLVKMDVEGHEPVILEAAWNAIAESPPAYILFESHPGSPFWSRPEVLLLRSLGYAFDHICRNLVGRFLIPMREGREPGRGMDFLAHRRG